jgi:uncharacterized protein (TIGR03083 family)
METDATRRIAALRRSHDDLAADVAGMDAGQLRSRSGCREWDVSRVLGHLGSGAEIGIRTLGAALSGEEAPPPETHRPIWERWNDMTPEDRAAGFRELDERHVSALESLDDDTRSTLLVQLPFLPQPVDVATLVTFRLSEHGLHSWDVRVGSRPESSVAGYLTELILDLTPMMAGFVGHPGEWRRGPVTVRVETTAPSRVWTLELGDSVRVDTTGNGSENTLRLPAEALVRLVAGRLAPAHTPDDVTIDGPVRLDDLRAVFPGY